LAKPDLGNFDLRTVRKNRTHPRNSLNFWPFLETEGRGWDDFLIDQSLSFRIYYVALYLAMRDVWLVDKNQNTDFSQLLGEMNPLFQWSGLSIDPVYPDKFHRGFRRAFHKDECVLEDGYEYSVKYLKTLEWADEYREAIMKIIPDGNHFAHYVEEALKRKDEILAKTI
jgi:hypothetical protein